ANLLPDDIALVLESPGLHDRKAVGKQGIGYPQIQMALLRRHLCHRQRHDVFQLHGLVAIQPLVL
ncbi:Transposase IS66 central domain-containing protein, partial [Dysosmobacter welbionis]